MSKKPVLPPNVPGVGDLHSLLAHLEHAENRTKLLAEVKSALDANQKAVRLLGAEEDIQKSLDHADRVKAAAERAMDTARAQSESIVAESEAQCAKRVKSLDEREETFEHSMGMLTDKLNKDRAVFENKSGEMAVKQNATQIRLDDLRAGIAEREKAISGREAAAEAKLATAKEMRDAAEAAQDRMKAALS